MAQKTFPSDPQTNIPVTVSQQATLWYVRLQAENVQEQDFIDFKQWLQSDALHRQAWQRLEKFGLQLQNIQHPLLSSALNAVHQEQVPQHKHPSLKLLAWGVLAMSSILGIYTVSQHQFLQQWQADYKSRVGEQRHIQLADGSTLTLNTNSAVNIHYDDQQRLIELVKGEIHLEVLPDTQHRPFYVRNRDGIMQDIGTTFNVRQSADYSILSVTEGEVEVRTKKSRQSANILANQQIQFSQHRLNSVEPLDHAYGAWSQGVLSVYKMPLPQFLDELDRYHRGVIYYDKQLQDIEVSGVFPVTDSRKVLDALQHSLPIEVNRHFHYFTTISPKNQ